MGGVFYVLCRLSAYDGSGGDILKSHARVVIVGGGVVGVGILYHFAKLGWSDVMLLERTELTAGSTWHAAGLLPLFNMSYTVGQIHKYSVDLYKRLEAETGQAVGFHETGNLRLATNRDRMDEYHHYCGTANTIGVPFEIIGPNQIKELWPLCDVEGLVGALFHPHDGHVAPADVTMAMAKGARDGGAEIHRHTEVTGFEQQRNGEWLVKTDKGNIACETVITATGNYARQTAAMVGLDIPVIPVEHQYIVTDAIPELIERHEAGLPEMAVLRESDASYYMREERQGLILGPYEVGAPAWAVDGVPHGFGQDLLPPDLDRLQPHIEAAIKRVPIFETAGIKDVVNGPIAYTPDGSPVLGPAPGLKNFWLAEGFSFGITAAGGAGHFLCEWIVNGEPPMDPLDLDPRRFGAYAGKQYTRRKNEEAYENVFTIHYPDEERRAARPAKTSAIHDKLDKLGAVWGQRYGWERPNWFAPEGVERKDIWSFRRSNHFEHVGNEHRAAREKAGLIDITSFSKFQVTGPGAEAFLDGLVANTLPKKVARHQALPRADQAWRCAQRIHHHARRGGELLSDLLRRCGALRWRSAGQTGAGRRQCAGGQYHHGAWRAGPGRAEIPRHPAQAHGSGSLQQGFSLALGAPHRDRPGAGARHAHQLRRRSGLGAAPRHRIPAPSVRRPDRGG